MADVRRCKTYVENDVSSHLPSFPIDGLDKALAHGLIPGGISSSFTGAYIERLETDHSDLVVTHRIE